jgi:hypothetical protein
MSTSNLYPIVKYKLGYNVPINVRPENLFSLDHFLVFSSTNFPGWQAGMSGYEDPYEQTWKKRGP